MLQVHSGSIWIGQKVAEKVRESSQQNQKRNFIIRITLDKVIVFLHFFSNLNCVFNYMFIFSFIYMCYIESKMVEYDSNTIFNILFSWFNI